MIDDVVLRRSLSAYIGFRLSLEDYEKLIEIMKKRGIANKSIILREAINVYYGLLCGANEVRVGNVVIQNPNIVVNAVSEGRRKGGENQQSNVNINININLSDVKKLVFEIHQIAGELHRRLSLWHERLPSGLYSDLAEPANKLLHKSVKARKLLEGVVVN